MSKYVLSCILLLLIFATPSFSQSNTKGSVHGVIVDSIGNKQPLQNATISVRPLIAAFWSSPSIRWWGLTVRLCLPYDSSARRPGFGGMRRLLVKTPKWCFANWDCPMMRLTS